MIIPNPEQWHITRDNRCELCGKFRKASQLLLRSDYDCDFPSTSEFWFECYDCTSQSCKERYFTNGELNGFVQR